MENVNQQAITILVKGIVNSAYNIMNEAKFNKGLTGRVLEIIDDDNYIVSINNKSFKVKSRFKLEINEIVKIISWNNDINELYVVY